MSYQRNYWSDGDIITAEKMNNLEAGVAGVNGGNSAVVSLIHEINGMQSVFFCFDFVRSVSGRANLSIESGGREFSMYGYGRNYFTLPLPPSIDEFNLALVVTAVDYNRFNFSFDGDISSTPIYGNYADSSNSWSSTGGFCFIITGDCSITITPKQ